MSGCVFLITVHTQNHKTTQFCVDSYKKQNKKQSDIIICCLFFTWGRGAWCVLYASSHAMSLLSQYSIVSNTLIKYIYIIHYIYGTFITWLNEWHHSFNTILCDYCIIHYLTDHHIHIQCQQTQHTSFPLPCHQCRSGQGNMETSP